MKRLDIVGAFFCFHVLVFGLGTATKRAEGTCTIQIGELINCGKNTYNDLEASFTVKDKNGDVIPHATIPSDVSVPINNKAPHTVLVGGKKLTILGEHVHDYVQFYYGDEGDEIGWATDRPNDGAHCKVVQDGNWFNDHESHGGRGCPNNWPNRAFHCEFPCNAPTPPRPTPTPGIDEFYTTNEEKCGSKKPPVNEAKDIPEGYSYTVGGRYGGRYLSLTNPHPHYIYALFSDEKCNKFTRFINHNICMELLPQEKCFQKVWKKKGRWPSFRRKVVEDTSIPFYIEFGDQSRATHDVAGDDMNELENNFEQAWDSFVGTDGPITGSSVRGQQELPDRADIELAFAFSNDVAAEDLIGSADLPIILDAVRDYRVACGQAQEITVMLYQGTPPNGDGDPGDSWFYGFFSYFIYRAPPQTTSPPAKMARATPGPMKGGSIA